LLQKKRGGIPGKLHRGATNQTQTTKKKGYTSSAENSQESKDNSEFKRSKNKARGKEKTPSGKRQAFQGKQTGTRVARLRTSSTPKRADFSTFIKKAE